MKCESRCVGFEQVHGLGQKPQSLGSSFATATPSATPIKTLGYLLMEVSEILNMHRIFASTCEPSHQTAKDYRLDCWNVDPQHASTSSDNV